MDFLRRIGRFIGGAAQNVGRAVQQAPRFISRGVQDAERARQQAVAQVQRNLPRFQAPPPPRIQLPQIQIPRVQAPKIDLGAVSRALSNYYGRTAASQVVPGIQRAIPQIDRNVQSFNERLLGGLGRTAIRTGEFVLPGKTENISEAAIRRLFPEAGSAAGRRGLTPLADPRSFGGRLGTGAKAAVDVAGIVLPSTAVTKGLQATQLAQRGMQGGRLARLGTIAATEAVGGIPASFASIAQARGQQKPVDLPKEVGIGLAIDAATPLGLKLLGKGYKAVRGAITNVSAKDLQAATKSLPGATAAQAKGREILNTLKGTKTAQQVDNVLTQNGLQLPSNIRTQVNNQIAGTTNTNQIRNILKNAVAEAQATRTIPVRPQRIADQVPSSAMQPKVPKGQEALYAEARKYKTADEFVNSQIKRPQPTDNVWQDTLPSGSKPKSVDKIVKSGGNPLYHDTSANGVLGILDSGNIKVSQAPFSQLAGQGKRVSTTRNFDNYSRYNKSPYRLVIDESKTGQRAIPDNREEFESIFKKNVPIKAVKSVSIDITNPALLDDIRTGKLADVIQKAKKKGIVVEPFDGKVLPNEGANAEIQTMTSKAFSDAFPEYNTKLKQLTDIWNKANKPTGRGFAPGTVGNIYETVPESAMRPKAPKGQEAIFNEARKYKTFNDFVDSQLNKFYGENGDQQFLIGLINKYKNKGKPGEDMTKFFNKQELARYKQTQNNYSYQQLEDIWNKANKVKLQTKLQPPTTPLTSPLTTPVPAPTSPLTSPLTTPLRTPLSKAPKGEAVPPKSSVQTVIDALAEAKPIRGKQEALYAAERARRAARVAAMGGKVQGEKGFFAQLGQLKGELPKAQFEGIRKQITQPVVDDLFNQIEKSNISVFEKITAKQGLAKLLGAEGGVVPTRGELTLLNEVFPKEFTDAILAKRTTMQKLGTIAGEVFNLPRSIMSTVDLSGPLRQGIFAIGRPKQFIPAFASMIKYAGSENAYQGLQQQLRSRANYQLMRQSRLALTDIDAPLLAREEAFMSNLAEKIPGFGILARASDRAYTGFLNKLRADVFDDLITKAKATGALADRPQIADDIANFVNASTGRGKLPQALERSAVALNAVFFSPRLMASRLNLLNPVYYIKLDPFVRKEALKSLFTFAATGATILGLAKAGGAEVGTDPRSSDFGKIKLGNTRYDPWGGFQQYMVLASRLITGEMISSTTGKEIKLAESFKDPTRLDIIQRFLESKQAPIASFVTGFLKGKTTTGETFNIPAEVVDRFLPMMTQDMYDLYKEYGPKGIAMGLPGIFGVGSQTYQDQIPVKTKTKSGKETTTWRQAPSLGESILNRITGKQITNVPQEEIAGLQETKKKETQYKIDLDKVKAEVLESGESQTIFNPVKNTNVEVFLKDGVVTTKDVKPPKPPKVKVSKARRGRRATGRRRGGRGRVAKVRVKAPKVPRVSVKGLPRVPKAKKVSFKVPKPKATARKSIKIKTG